MKNKVKPCATPLSLTNIMDNLKIPKLNGDHYTAWFTCTHTVLVQRNCWEVVDSGFNAELKDDKKKINEKTLMFFFFVVEDNFLDNIAECT